MVFFLRRERKGDDEIGASLSPRNKKKKEKSVFFLKEKKKSFLLNIMDSQRSNKSILLERQNSQCEDLNKNLQM